MPGSASLFYMHALLESDYAILTYIMRFFVLCRGPKSGGMAQYYNQRWSPRGRPWPRGHILKSLALASKVKSLALASKPQVLENCPVLGSRTALLLEQLKFRWKTPETSQKICEPLLCFPRLEHRRSLGEGDRGPPPPQLKFHQWQKCDKKAYSFFSFSFFLAFFAYNSITNNNIEDQGSGSPSI